MRMSHPSNHTPEMSVAEALALFAPGGQRTFEN
jgi:hypothetical protein